MHKYTVEPGRHIHRDGEPFVSITRQGNTTPVEADTITRVIAKKLNASEFQKPHHYLGAEMHGHAVETFLYDMGDVDELLRTMIRDENIGHLHVGMAALGRIRSAIAIFDRYRK
jgi:hypothetical protein